MAAPYCQDAWRLLELFAEVASGPDRQIAAAAARAAAAIAEPLEDGVAFEQDIPSDVIDGALEAWQALAGAPDRWADVRVHALAISDRLAAIRRALGGDVVPYDLAARAADGDPEVRRAAFELLPTSLDDLDARPAQAAGPGEETARRGSEARALAAKAAADDPDDVVALAAMQALCSELAFGAPAEPVLAALGDAGLARLRSLAASAEKLPAGAMLDAARCLAADASADSQQALRDLPVDVPAALLQKAQTARGPGGRDESREP